MFIILCMVGGRCFRAVDRMLDEPPELLPIDNIAVAGHCRYATALHGRQLSLLQMEGAYRGVERGQRPRSSLNARSVFRPPRFLRNLATYRGRVVRELLSHYNNDPLHLKRVCV